MRTRAPSVFSTLMLERATRLCRMSPQMATVSPATRPLTRRIVSASSSACVGCWCAPSPALITEQSIFCDEQLHGARRMVAHHDDVGPHGVERHRGVDQRLALLHRGGGDVHVHDVGAEPLRRHLEGALRAGRGFEEEVDQRAPAQHDRAFCPRRRLASANSSARSRRKLISRAPSPSTVRRWRWGKWSGSTLATALAIKGRFYRQSPRLGQAALAPQKRAFGESILLGS